MRLIQGSGAALCVSPHCLVIDPSSMSGSEMDCRSCSIKECNQLPWLCACVAQQVRAANHDSSLHTATPVADCRCCPLARTPAVSWSSRWSRRGCSGRRCPPSGMRCIMAYLFRAGDADEPGEPASCTAAFPATPLTSLLNSRMGLPCHSPLIHTSTQPLGLHPLKPFADILRPSLLVRLPLGLPQLSP